MQVQQDAFIHARHLDWPAYCPEAGRDPANSDDTDMDYMDQNCSIRIAGTIQKSRHGAFLDWSITSII